MSESKQKRTARPFACLGRRSDGRTKTGVILQLMDLDDHLIEAPRRYEPKRGSDLRRLRCGGVYVIDEVQDGSIIPSTARFVKFFPDETKRREWMANESVSDVIAESRIREKNTEDPAELARALRPWRRIYGKMIGNRRRDALELIVLRTLRTPISKRELDDERKEGDE
jgi:hypothetical protein